MANQQQKKNEALLIERGTLIDGTGRGPIPNTSLLIEKGRITSISQQRIPVSPERVTVLKAEGKYILPGLIDMHTHTSSWTPPLFLIHGVTSVMDTGNYPEWIFAQAEGIAKNRIFGARLFPVGKTISPSGQGPEVQDPRFATETIEQAKAVTRKMIKMNAIGIKVHQWITAEMLREVSQIAREAGIPVTGHLGFLDAREATLNGIDGLQHATGVALATIKNEDKRRRIKQLYPNMGYSPVEFYMEPENYDELIELLVERNIVLIPTLYHFIGKKLAPRRQEYFEEDKQFLTQLDPLYFPFEVVDATYNDQPYAFQPLPPADLDNYLDKMEVGWRKLCDFIGRFKKAGGRVLAGTDDGNIGIPGKGLHREMEILVTCGFSPMEALLAATKHAAEFIHLEKDIGTLEEGKLGDVTITNNNPLEDIRNTQTLAGVIKGGEIIDTTAQPRFRNPLPMPTFSASGPIPVSDFVPRLHRIEPTSEYEGAAEVHLIIHGKNFYKASIVRFDTANLDTQYVSSTRLEAKIPKERLHNPGSYAVTVVNPGSGGGPSSIADFMVKFKHSA